MNDLIWFNASDLMIFSKSVFLQKCINKGGTIPLLNVKWIAKNGDYVHNGDVIFSAKINADGYQHSKYTIEYDKEIYNYGEVIVKSPKNGIFFTKNSQKFFECNLKRPICAICNDTEEYNKIDQSTEFIISKNDYDNYELYSSEYDVAIYVHQSCNIEQHDIVGKISNWLLGKRRNELIYGTYGKNEINQKQSSFYINEDFTIDCLTDMFSILSKSSSLPEFIKFRKINGDFHIWFYTKENTLKGCPVYVNGDFNCDRCNLKKFEFMPLYIEGNCDAKHNSISSFEGMPSYIGGVFNISNNDFTDESWEYAKKNIEADFRDYNIKKNKFVTYRKELF